MKSTKDSPMAMKWKHKKSPPKEIGEFQRIQLTLHLPPYTHSDGDHKFDDYRFNPSFCGKPGANNIIYSLGSHYDSYLVLETINYTTSGRGF